MARNDRGIQALRTDRSVSIQFHPEVGLAHAREFLGEMAVPEADRAEALETVTPENVREATAARWVFTNFLAGARGRTRRALRTTRVRGRRGALG